MSKLISRLLVVLAFGWAGSAPAVPITQTVIVGSQEWAQVNLFTDVSWNFINTQCPGGVCLPGSQIKGYDLEGWTWASIDLVQTLFNGFTGRSDVAPDAHLELDSAWAPDFLALFASSSLPSATSSTVWGLSSTKYDTDLARSAWLRDREEGSQDVAATGSLEYLRESRPDIGAWFVRTVPAPATLPLLGLGLAALGYSRRKRKQHT